MRYPIGIQTFETIIKGKYAYADKTDLVYELAQEHVCFLSRPRRADPGDGGENALLGRGNEAASQKTI